jgi:hypothetical protein
VSRQKPNVFECALAFFPWHTLSIYVHLDAHTSPMCGPKIPFNLTGFQQFQGAMGHMGEDLGGLGANMTWKGLGLA